jgi:hypothetical protein
MRQESPVVAIVGTGMGTDIYIVRLGLGQLIYDPDPNLTL